MVAIFHPDERYELQDGNSLTAGEIFAHLLAGDIDPQLQCRIADGHKWQPIGQRFAIIGHYGIIKKLGEGSFGDVYLGFDIRCISSGEMGRLVAIKKPCESLLLSANGSAQILRELFSQEALLTARLNMCPYVVKVLEHDLTTPFIALEYCESTLSKRILKPYNLADVVTWGYQIAVALEAAHNLQPDCLIHRDLKPQNIMLHNSVAKLSDFGTSQTVEQNKSLRTSFEGFTPLYAPPEAFKCKAYPASDIWSLGVVLYRLISRKLPFNGESLKDLENAICYKQPVLLSDAPSAVVQLVQRCLGKESTQRPTAAECKKLLGGYVPENIEVIDEQKVDVAEEKRKSNKVRFGFALIATLAFVVLVAVAAWQYIGTSDDIVDELENFDGILAEAALIEEQTKHLLSDLLISKTGPEIGALGETMVITIEVKNPGSAKVENVEVVDTLPEGIVYQSASQEPTKIVDNQVIWNLGTLESREVRTITVTLKANKVGDWPCNAQVNSERGHQFAFATLQIR